MQQVTRLSSQKVVNMLKEQPFYVVTDDAYDRMLNKLIKGEPAYTYITTCPHRNPADCRCPKNENILKEGRIVRIVDGVEKKVMKLSEMN